jgi:type IV pilus assembly protein PilF
MMLGLALATGVGMTGCASLEGGGAENSGVERHVGDNREAAKVNTQLAAGYMERGELKVAMEKIRRAIDADASYAQAHHVHALLLDRLGEEREAGEAYRKAYRLDGDNPAIANNYAGYLCRQGEYDRAQALFRAAYEDPLYDTPGFALINSGRCYQRQGDHDRALTQFRRALDEGARQPGALAGLARSLYETGEIEAAAEAMRRYEQRFRHTPNSLVTAIRIDRALGDDQALANHQLILRGRFPDSPEAKAMRDGGVE